MSLGRRNLRSSFYLPFTVDQNVSIRHKAINVLSFFLFFEPLFIFFHLLLPCTLLQKIFDYQNTKCCNLIIYHLPLTLSDYFSELNQMTHYCNCFLYIPSTDFIFLLLTYWFSKTLSLIVSKG